MDPILYLQIGLILAGGGMLQSAAGFGYGLFSVTLLLLVGLAPYEAIPIVTVATMVQGITGVWHHRRVVPWKVVGVAALLIFMTVPVGVWLLGRITLMGDSQVRQIFGVIVLVMVLCYAGWRPKLRESIGPGWTVAAMLSSGLLAGLCGMAGPPIVVWAMAHDWSSQKTRATLWALFLAMTPTGLFFLYQRFGTVVLESAGLSLLMVPAVLLGSVPGIWIGNRISKLWLRRIAVILLFFLAVYMIAEPYFKG